MLQMQTYNKLENRLFFIWLTAILGFFVWSRVDFSNRIYYFGDGNVIVEMIRLMLTSHNWDPNWTRMANMIHPQEEMIPLIKIPDSSVIFYHMSGYMIIGASVCNIIYSFSFSDIPIQNVLRALNIIFQLATMYLLFSIGRKMLTRNIGLLAATFFAIFPLATMEAHYERPESWLCLLATALVHCMIFFRGAPLRYSLYAGVLIGLSAATKLSQLFICIIPGFILIHLWLNSPDKNRWQKIKELSICCGLMALGLAIAMYINVPFILRHPTETLESVKTMSSFYSTPTYPYAERHYRFVEQIFVSVHYFQAILGNPWCLIFITGVTTSLLPRINISDFNRVIFLSLIISIFFLIFYSAMQVNFVERTFSSIEGIICLISANGFFNLIEGLKRFDIKKLHLFFILNALVIAVMFKPLVNNYYFVQRYINHSDQPPRIKFQEQLKSDFHGFWIKNVFFTYKINNEIPAKPEKAPRIYQIDDLNEYWTKDYLTKLESNGFHRIATYCSDFADMPPNTLTLYHGAAKNHYLVRDDEWPKDLPLDYFKTNCK